MKQGITFIIIYHAALLFTILALASGMFVVGCFARSLRSMFASTSTPLPASSAY